MSNSMMLHNLASIHHLHEQKSARRVSGHTNLDTSIRSCCHSSTPFQPHVRTVLSHGVLRDNGRVKLMQALSQTNLYIFNVCVDRAESSAKPSSQSESASRGAWPGPENRLSLAEITGCETSFIHDNHDSSYHTKPLTSFTFQTES